MESLQQSIPLSPEEEAHSRRLAQLIDQLCAEAGGFLPFADFMEAALYTPGLGYYSGAPEIFGPGGDFTTAPELSPLFARALARQVGELLDETAPRIIEFGPGSGALAADLLAALDAQGRAPERYQLVELSPALARRQQERILRQVPHLAPRCEWITSLPGEIDGVVIGNEVLDAMPTDLIVWRHDAWHERGIGRLDADGRFQFVERPPDASLLAAISTHLPQQPTWPEPYETELSRRVAGFIATLARCLRRGAALFIDYGFPAREYYHPERQRGTVVAHRRHRVHADVLGCPGLQDLTCHVDFSTVAREAAQAGCELLGFTSQARFLINCDIAQLIDASPDDPVRWLRETNALQRLVSEAEMGELFKVIAFGRGVAGELPAFDGGDRRERLDA